MINDEINKSDNPEKKQNDLSNYMPKENKQVDKVSADEVNAENAEPNFNSLWV